MADSYKDVAAKIRRDVEGWPVGKPIPGIDRLKEKYGVARETAHRAVKHLVSEGTLYSEGRRGTFVRPVAPEPTVIRDRAAYRDEIGYFFDRGAQDWRGLGTPTQEVAVPPPDVARILNTPPDTEVMVRDRAVGPPDAEYPDQLTTSYLPMPLVGQLPILGAARTGPGGIYDRLEEHADEEIEWDETVSARPADDTEQRLLRIGAGLPVLIVTRRSVLNGQVVEVNQTRMAADKFALSYQVPRDVSARRS